MRGERISLGRVRSGIGFAALAAFAVMLVTFAIAVAKGLHRIVDIAWGSASPRWP